MTSLSSQLRTRFALSAKHHAHRAVTAYQTDSHPDFYLHAGTALELAIKARLVGDHGVHCITPDERGWFRTMVVYETKGIDDSRARTVGAAEALRRLRQLESQLPEVFDSNVAETLDRRNVGAHVGHAEAPSAEEFLSHAAAFVRAIDQLLLHDRTKFWSEHAGLTNSLVADELSAVRVRVQRALAQSRSIARQLPTDAFAALAAGALAALEEEGPDVVGVTCPGCGALGWGIGEVVDEGSGESEYEDGAIHWRWIPDLKLELANFICRTCELALDGREEITEAGLPAKVPNDRAVPSDAIPDYDPDADRDDWRTF